MNSRNHTQMQRSALFVKKSLKLNMLMIKKFSRFRDHCHYTGEYTGAAQSICNLNYGIPKEITLIFHKGSNCNYHFLIKKLAEDFEGQFTY